MSLTAVFIGVLLLAANAFFVAAEFALLAARRSRIEQLAAEGNRRATYALAGLRELSLMLAGAQLGITMASLGLGAVAEPAVHHGLEVLLHDLPIPAAVSSGLSLAIALGIVIFLHMVVGEMAPKSLAIAHPERSALTLAVPFRAFALVVRPFIVLLNALANAVVRAVGVQPQDELATVHSPAELGLLVRESAARGTIAAEQHDLLARALVLSGLDAESAMVPRSDIVAVPTDATIDELEAVASSTGRSRVPVYEGDLDHVTGILHFRDLLKVPTEARERTTAGDLARPALIVPESKRLEALMLEMRQQRQHIAIVIDEYGTVTGLVALEDLLEELIGEFEDESDRAQGSVRRRRDGAALVSGALRPDELAELIGLELPSGDWETVAGLVIAELDRLPEVGDVVTVDGVQLEVTKMDGHRILELAVSDWVQNRPESGQKRTQ